MMDNETLTAIGAGIAGVASGFVAYFKTRSERKGTAKVRNEERDDIEHRVTLLEGEVGHINTDIGELKQDVKETLKGVYEIKGAMKIDGGTK